MHDAFVQGARRNEVVSAYAEFHVESGKPSGALQIMRFNGTDFDVSYKQIDPSGADRYIYASLFGAGAVSGALNSTVSLQRIFNACINRCDKGKKGGADSRFLPAGRAEEAPGISSRKQGVPHRKRRMRHRRRPLARAGIESGFYLH